LREGAHLIESAGDILAVLRQLPRQESLFESTKPITATPPPDEQTLDRWRVVVTGLLSSAPVALDELVRAADAPPAVVQMILLELQLAGRLERHPGGRVSMVY
jgi:DNA processing protein